MQANGDFHSCISTQRIGTIFKRIAIPFRTEKELPSKLEPLSEVERALLVVEVLHAPHPELLGLLL